MDKEKITRHVLIVVQPSLFEKFQAKCKVKYKTVSEVIREFMVKYVEKK